MCVLSMVIDWKHDEWQKRMEEEMKKYMPPYSPSQPPAPPAPVQVTQEEVDEFRRLLERAREYDKKMGQADCELEEKRNRLRKLAEELKIEIAFI